jgi:phosphatidylglycerophosphatase A
MRNYIVPPIPATVWQNPLHFVAFGFGSGAIPYAPGTFGTIMAIPFYLLMRYLPVNIYLILVAVIAIVSAWICQRVSDEIKVNDHQGMCLDEFVGFFVTMINAPHGLIWIVAGFILFRIFDIWKPWPIAYLDTHVHGGIGMVLDDVCAGIYAFIILKFFSWAL